MDISKNQWRSTRGEGPLSIRRIKTLTRSLIWTSNDRNIPGSKKIMFQNLGGWRSRFSYRKLAAQEGPNSRLSSSFSFFSFWLIKAWCTSNLISNLAVCIDEFNQHNFILKICGPLIEIEHLWVCTKFIPISLCKTFETPVIIFLSHSGTCFEG